MAKRDTVVEQGYRLIYAAYPEELTDGTNVEQCGNCKNGIVPRKAGHVCHCHYCGEVIRTNN